MGLIIKDKIPMFMRGYPTVSDKYDVAGGVLFCALPIHDRTELASIEHTWLLARRGHHHSLHIRRAWILTHLLNGRNPSRHTDRIPSLMDSGTGLLLCDMRGLPLSDHLYTPSRL